MRQITAILLIGLLFALTACASPVATTPPTITTYTPNLTAQQAMGIVAAAIRASTPDVQASAGYYKAEFNHSSRQWVVTTWSSEEASTKYLGYTYLVDDATGEIINPPPVYNPK